MLHPLSCGFWEFGVWQLMTSCMADAKKKQKNTEEAEACAGEREEEDLACHVSKAAKNLDQA